MRLIRMIPLRWRAVYREYLLQDCGPLASKELSGIFATADEEGWFRTASSPEYYAYTPHVGTSG